MLRGGTLSGGLNDSRAARAPVLVTQGQQARGGSWRLVALLTVQVSLVSVRQTQFLTPHSLTRSSAFAAMFKVTAAPFSASTCSCSLSYTHASITHFKKWVIEACV